MTATADCVSINDARQSLSVPGTTGHAVQQTVRIWFSEAREPFNVGEMTGRWVDRGRKEGIEGALGELKYSSNLSDLIT